MFCSRKSEDPLLRELLDQYGLTLLRSAKTKTETSPGKIIVTVGQKVDDDTFICDWEEVLANPRSGDIESAEYQPIVLQSKSVIDRRLAAELSRVPGLNEEGVARINAALERACAESLALSLENCRRWYLSPTVRPLHLQIIDNQLTDRGSQFIKNGFRLFPIIETITARSAHISSGRDLTAAAEMLADIHTFANAALSARLSSQKSTSIIIERLEEEMVIGIRAAEIVHVRDGLRIKGVDEILALRGANDLVKETKNDLIELQQEGEAFISL
ncbi:MAG: hypothetical protein ACPGNV_17135 [Mangrovicoccus sp.]